MKRVFMILMFALLLVSSSNAEELERVISNIQKAYNGVSDFRADFVQESTNKALKYTITDTGIVYFKKPGKMRWDYFKKIDEREILLQKIVNDGEKFYYYIPADNLVMVEDVRAVFTARAPNNFIAGMGKLKEDFEVREGYPKGMKKDADLIHLELIPKESLGGVAKLFIAVDKKKFLVKESITVDPYENTTRIIFSNIQTNRSIPSDVFKFVIPAGVKVKKAGGEGEK